MNENRIEIDSVVIWNGFDAIKGVVVSIGKNGTAQVRFDDGMGLAFTRIVKTASLTLWKEPLTEEEEWFESL